MTITNSLNGASHPLKRQPSYVDGFGTRAIHVGSEPDPETGAVIPSISLSTTYKQNGVGNHKVRLLGRVTTGLAFETLLHSIGL